MRYNYSISTINLTEYPILQNIKSDLIIFDKNLQMKKFDEIFSNLNNGLILCEKLRTNAIKKNDEYCANCSFLLKINFVLIHDIANFWKSCEDYEYNEAWIHLQNALEKLRLTLKYLDDKSKLEIEKNYEYFSLIEKLFPFVLFTSIARMDNEVKCSICNKSPFDPECNHIEGEIYWGEIAESIFVKMGKLNHVLLCPEPKDKRCIHPIEYDKKHPEESPFVHVYYFIKHSGRPLRHFRFKLSEKEIPRKNYDNYPLTMPCPCGRNTSFKECCANKKIIKIPHYDFYFNG